MCACKHKQEASNLAHRARLPERCESFTVTNGEGKNPKKVVWKVKIQDESNRKRETEK